MVSCSYAARNTRTSEVKCEYQQTPISYLSCHTFYSIGKAPLNCLFSRYMKQDILLRHFTHSVIYMYEPWQLEIFSSKPSKLTLGTIMEQWDTSMNYVHEHLQKSKTHAKTSRYLYLPAHPVEECISADPDVLDAKLLHQWYLACFRIYRSTFIRLKCSWGTCSASGVDTYLLVAPMIKTFFFAFIPSISVRTWLMTRSAAPPGAKNMETK